MYTCVTGAYVHFDRTTVMNSGASGILLHPGAKATLAQCSINSNSHSGLTIAPGAVCFLQECVLKCNGWTHISVGVAVSFDISKKIHYIELL